MPRPPITLPPPGRNDPRTLAMLDAFDPIEESILKWEAKQAAAQKEQTA
jgi:hypothetical protein